MAIVGMLIKGLLNKGRLTFLQIFNWYFSQNMTRVHVRYQRKYTHIDYTNANNTDTDKMKLAEYETA